MFWFLFCFSRALSQADIVSPCVSWQFSRLIGSGNCQSAKMKLGNTLIKMLCSTYVYFSILELYWWLIAYIFQNGHKMSDGLMVFCRVDPWESYQDTWQTTCSVLEHHRDLMKVSPNFGLNAVRFLLVLHLEVINWAVPLQRVTGCILSNVNTPSTTPVIGQPQNGTSPIYQNTANKSVASKWPLFVMFGVLENRSFVID